MDEITWTDEGGVIIKPSAVRVQLIALLTCTPSDEELEVIEGAADTVVMSEVHSTLEESYGSEPAVTFVPISHRRRGLTTAAARWR